MEKKSVAKNYVYNLIYQILTILLPLVTTPYLSRVLGAKAIGIYGYTLSITTYFILFGSLGISMYGQRQIAYLEDNREKMSKNFWEIIILRSITLIISIFFFIIFFTLNGPYTLYYRILLLEIVANFFDISWLFQGIEEFDKTVIRNLIVKFLCLILIFTCVKSPKSLYIYFLIYVSADLIGNISLWLYLPKYVVKPKKNNIELKKHLKSVLLLFLPQIAIQIYTVLDKTMLGFITRDMVEVGYYEQAQKVARVGLLLMSSLQTVMNSRIANLYSKNKGNEIRGCLQTSINFVWLLGIPIMFGLIAISNSFVPLYYGKGFEGVKNILIATSPILIIIGLNGVTGIQYLIQVGKQKIFTISVIIGCLVNIILNNILINIFSGVGAAIASVIAEIVILFYQLKYFRKDFKNFNFFSSGIKCLISGIIMFFIVLLLNYNMSVTIFSLLIQIIIGAIVYIIILLLLKYEFLYDIIKQFFGVINRIMKGCKKNG